jgi:Putative auto-transporter adhesin, head GIN domain
MRHAMNLLTILNRTENKFVSIERRFDGVMDMSFKRLRQLISVTGNGDLTERTYTVSSFLRLHLTLGGTVEIIKSDEEKVIITTDENLHTYISATNSGRTLYLATHSKLQAPIFTSLNIQIFVRQLDTIYIASSGDAFIMEKMYQNDVPLDIKIQSEGDTILQLSAPQMRLSTQCNGNIVITGVCDDLNARIQNEGDFDAKGLQAKKVQFTTHSNGNALISASESLVIKHFASGYIHYFGNGRLNDIKHFGKGEVKHCQS